MTTDGIMQVARSVAASYTRRCHWADKRDMEQEAFAAIWYARRNYDPTLGSFEPYAWMTAIQAVRRWLWTYSAPVKQTSRTPAPLAHAALDPEAPCRRQLPDERLDQQRTLARVAKVLAPHDLGARVLAGYRSAEVAEELGVSVQQVYKDTSRAREALREHNWEDA